MSLTVLLLAAASGIASHVFYFHGNLYTHLHSILYVNTVILSYAVYTLALIKFYGFDSGPAFSQSSTIFGAFLAGLYGSLMIWRIFLNPLNKLPGPWLARLGTVHLTFSLIRAKGHGYYMFKALHDKYGPIVRTGSSDLSIADPDFMVPTYGAGSTVIKSQWYDFEHPKHSLQTVRDVKLHAQRRKVWAPAFSDRALRDYEAKIDDFNDKLVECVSDSAAKGDAIDMALWFNLWSFDVMARLAFGKGYGMLKAGKKHWALQVLSDGMILLAYGITDWAFAIMKCVPGALNELNRLNKFCHDELIWRVRNSDAVDEKGGSDIMSWLLKAYEGFDHPEDDVMLLQDVRLIVIAGSDTSASCLTYLFYHLAEQPEEVEKLRQELRPLTQGDWSDKDIRHAQHLNACINEALRMHPPVPSGVSRITPKEGLRVGNTYIPPHTVYQMPQYVMGRDEKIYDRANDFVPERWYSQPEMVKHQDAWAPFSMGPFGCIGKQLAYTELRTLTTRLVLGFDVKLAPGEDGHRLLYETRDNFTVDCGGLDLQFTKV